MKKRIMIDMDDVLYVKGILKLVNEFEGTDYTYETITTFYLQDLVKNKDSFFKYFFSKNLYDYCEIPDQAVAIVEKLNEQYDVYIGTSFIFKDAVPESGKILNDKYQALLFDFPFINPYRFVFLGDKSVMDCAIKIDDKLENLDGAEIKLLYTAYHNHHFSNEFLHSRGVIRVNDWHDIEKILLPS